MFDYKAYAKSMREQSIELIPAYLEDYQKEYIAKTVGNFALLAGESLCNDTENNFSDGQKILLVQIVAEWTFHKSIDLIRANVDKGYLDAILQKIASVVFEVGKQTLIKGLPKGKLLQAVEYHMIKTYNECIDELPIDDYQKEIAKSRSNIDEMAAKAKLEDSLF